MVVIGGVSYKDELMVSSRRIDIYCLDNGTIRWSHKAKPSPVAWTKAGWTVYKGELYIAGGSVFGPGNSQQTLFMGDKQDKVGKYNMQQDHWEMLPNMLPSTLSGPLLYIASDILYVIDGVYMGSTSSRKRVRWLDLKNLTNGWGIMRDKLPYSISGPNTIVQVGDIIYIIGKTGVYSKSVISWNISNDNGYNTIGWKAYMNVYRSDSYMCIVTDQKKYIWALAGCKDCLNEGFIERFDIQNNTWLKVSKNVPNSDILNKSLESMNAIVAFGCGFSEGFIFALFAGLDGLMVELDQHFYVFDTLNNTWARSPTKVKVETYSPVMAVVNVEFDLATQSTQPASVTLLP